MLYLYEYLHLCSQLQFVLHVENISKMPATSPIALTAGGRFFCVGCCRVVVTLCLSSLEGRSKFSILLQQPSSLACHTPPYTSFAWFSRLLVLRKYLSKPPPFRPRRKCNVCSNSSFKNLKIKDTSYSYFMRKWWVFFIQNKGITWWYPTGR